MKKTNVPLDRLSIVLASVSLCLVLQYFVPVDRSGSINSRLIFSLKLDTFSLILAMTVLLATFGAHWVFQAYDKAIEKKRLQIELFYHLLLPAVTVLVLVVVLREMARTPLWWAVLALGIILFGLVLTAEYMTLSGASEQAPFAIIALIALAHSFFLILSISVRTATARLYLLLPLLTASASFVSLRTISLRTQQRPSLAWVALVSVLITQIAAVLYYLFLTPVQYGLILTGTLFIGDALVVSAHKGKLNKATWIEVVTASVAILIFAFF